MKVVYPSRILEPGGFQEGVGEFPTDWVGEPVKVQVNMWYVCTKVAQVVDTITLKHPLLFKALPCPDLQRALGK